MPSCREGLGTRYARHAVSKPEICVNFPAPRQPDLVANTLGHRIASPNLRCLSGGTERPCLDQAVWQWLSQAAPVSTDPKSVDRHRLLQSCPSNSMALPLTSRQPRGGASSRTATLGARTNCRTFCRTGENHVDWALAGSRFSIASHSATGSPATQPL